MPKILQITFGRLSEERTPEEQEDAQKKILDRAHRIAVFPGLIWKIWIANETSLGGTYLFEDEMSAKAYLNSTIPDDIRHLPGFTTELFDIETAPSAITHAPLTRGPKP